MRVMKERKNKNVLSRSLFLGAVACSLITLVVIMMDNTSDTSLRKTAISELVVDEINRKINDNKENIEVLKELDSTLSLEERTLKVQERYLQKWLVPDKQDYVQVLENHLPPESLHQEGGVCVIDSKLYLVGGGNGTKHDFDALKVIDKKKALKNLVINSKGSQVVTIYDMKDRTTTFGPRFPYLPANHIACAKAPDGVTIHLTGGFNQEARDKTEGSFNYHYTLDTSKENGNWERKADMPMRTGAHGCDFMADNRMYCVGGAVAQWGPFSNKMMIYDPVSDTWEMGPNMPTPRDHTFATIAIQGRKKLYVAGGRTHIQELHPSKSNPAVVANTNVVEIYDMDTNKWNRAKDILSERAAIGVIPYDRNAKRRKNEEPNLLLVGGQHFLGNSGSAQRIIEEYDIINDLYYCLERLTWPTFGGALGIHDGTLHVVGGAEWLGLSATRRVQLYDLKRAPPPRQCFYESVPVFDQWERTWDQAKPWPNINKKKRVKKD